MQTSAESYLGVQLAGASAHQQGRAARAESGRGYDGPRRSSRPWHAVGGSGRCRLAGRRVKQRGSMATTPETLSVSSGATTQRRDDNFSRPPSFPTANHARLTPAPPATHPCRAISFLAACLPRQPPLAAPCCCFLSSTPRVAASSPGVAHSIATSAASPALFSARIFNTPRALRDRRRAYIQ